jgi:hypothetical protein
MKNTYRNWRRLCLVIVFVALVGNWVSTFLSFWSIIQLEQAFLYSMMSWNAVALVFATIAIWLQE